MVDVDPVLDQSKRFKKFRDGLTKTIPRIPNDWVSLRALQSKRPTDLLITYMCWRLRHVGVRSRKVTGLTVLEGDPRAEALNTKIDVFIDAVKAGSDLAPYLSKKAHRDGYVMGADPARTNTATWEDKDFVLNVMGLHHFHLGLRQEASGLMARTNEVLFASVSRDTFNVLGLFDHSVFDWTVDDAMVPERERLWSIYGECRAAQAGPGAMLLGGIGGGGITTAGTPTVVTMMAIRQIECIREIEPKLDDSEYVKDFFGQLAATKKIKPAWYYDHLDFGLLNEPSGDFKCLMLGPN